MQKSQFGFPKEKWFIDLLNQYLNAFNTRNMAFIVDILAVDVKVSIDGKVVSNRRKDILPSYETDWKKGIYVKKIQEPSVVDEDDHNVCVGVALDNGSLTLDVVYVFRKSDRKQVEHRISNIKRYKEEKLYE